MKYAGMPSAMWMLYKTSFRNHLVSDLGFTDDAANRITKQAKPKYRGGYETITKRGCRTKNSVAAPFSCKNTKARLRKVWFLR